MALFRKILKYGAYGAANFAGAFILASVAGTHYTVGRDTRRAKELRELDGLEVRNIEVETTDGIPISAWYVKKSRSKVVILLAGRHSNREKNIAKARIYLEKGYSVLMPDLRGTGKSGGKVISFGWHERKDLLTLHRFLRANGFTEIAAHGFSMGAATICYSLLHRLSFSFIVLESCYANLNSAMKGAFAKYNVPLPLLSTINPLSERVSGFKRENMQPKNLIHLIKCPLLVMAGDNEIIVSAKATRALFKRNRAPFSKIHFFENGVHENFAENFNEEYKNVLEEFLSLTEAYREA